MKDHELKCWNPFFDAILENRKHFEYRKNDRDFKPGDTLFLREYNNIEHKYTGRCIRVLCHSVWSGLPGLMSGYCIMEISITQSPWTTPIDNLPPRTFIECNKGEI